MLKAENQISDICNFLISCITGHNENSLGIFSWATYSTSLKEQTMWIYTLKQEF